MRSERGFVGIRMLAVLGLLVALVWVVPLVFLQGVDTDRTGAPGATGVAEPVGSTSGSTSGSPLGEPAPTGTTGIGDPVSDPIREADDVQAQAMLNEAIRVAQVYYSENGTFDGFGPDVAVRYDPSIVYTQGAPAPDMVSLSVSPTTVVLVTVVELNGGYLCAAAMGDIVTFGRTNAAMPADCQGGWQ
ncbi:MAG: hypothetical protein WB297_04585 [Actinomycetota bacterium]